MKYLLRRLIAYGIDMLIISIITSVFSFIPIFYNCLSSSEQYSSDYQEKLSVDYDFYSKLYDKKLDELKEHKSDLSKYVSTLDSFDDETYNKVVIEVFSDMMDSMKFYSYNLMKMRMPISVLSIIVSILYFSIVPLLLGKTLGMHLFHMNFESENKILFSNYFIRSIFLTGSISFLISSIILYKLDYSSFYNVYLIISALNIGYNLANLIMIIARKNHRGLNDLFGGVSVVWRNLC